MVYTVKNKYTGEMVAKDCLTPVEALIDAAMCEDGLNEWALLEHKRNYYRALVITQDDYLRLGHWVYKKGG